LVPQETLETMWENVQWITEQIPADGTTSKSRRR
jgi:hypothetical protein